MKMLERYLEEMHKELQSASVDLPKLKVIISELLRELSRVEYNSDKACRFVGDFIMLKLICDATMINRIDKLPGELSSIIKDIGMCLHDTHTAPEISRNFDSTPDLLLRRIEALPY